MTSQAQAADAALRGWHVIARIDDLPASGAARPAVLAPGGLDEPVMLVRDRQGSLRGLSNVCTHRGHVLLEEARADLRNIQCRYHGRCFGLDGQVIRSPGFDGVSPDELEPLPEVKLATWGPLVFASLNDALPFETWMAGPRERLGFLPTSTWKFADRSVYNVDAHWTVYVENYLEGLHIPFVHPSLAKVVDWRAYRYVVHSQGNLQVAETATGLAFELPPGHPDVGHRVSAFYFWLFPTTMLNIYPWGLSLNIVEPIGPTETRVVFESYVGDPGLRDQGAGSGLDQVEREDEAVVTSVQVGIRSRLYRPGRLSPHHEACVEHFRRLVSAKVEP